jgi:hypothetical protein
VRTHLIPSRPHLQGDPAPLRLRHSAGNLTDGAGLLLLRRLWDQLGLGRTIDESVRGMPGAYRPSLFVEIWVALLFYGGVWLDDLRRFRSRGVRRLFGWATVPDPTTIGRFLRRAAEGLVPALDELVWRALLVRWQAVGMPRRVMLVLDSTVVVRYGTTQAGAEKGYNPKKPGRPSHHPLVAFLAETGDCLGIRWRPGSAGTAAGAVAWVQLLVHRLRSAGVHEITIRLDKGFFSKEMVETLEALDVTYVLKVPNWAWVRARLRPFRRSAKRIASSETLWTAGGTLYGARLLSLQSRRPLRAASGELALETYEVTKRAHVLTNIPGLHALSAWRLYNRGAVVEQRIQELAQLGLGRTAVDSLGGNRLLWAMGALAYQLLHVIRTTAFTGTWRRAQPERLRNWIFRLPAKLTRHARKVYVQPQRSEAVQAELLRALRTVSRLRAPPLTA